MRLREWSCFSREKKFWCLTGIEPRTLGMEGKHLNHQAIQLHSNENNNRYQYTLPGVRFRIVLSSPICPKLRPKKKNCCVALRDQS